MLNSQTTTKNTSGLYGKKEETYPKVKSLLAQKRCMDDKELYDILMDESTQSSNEQTWAKRQRHQNKTKISTERYSCQDLQTDQIGNGSQTNTNNQCNEEFQDACALQYCYDEMDEDTIVYTDADKVKKLVEKLCCLINEAKAKTPAGSQSIPQAEQAELNSILEQTTQCLFYQNVQSKIQSQIESGESPDSDPLFLGQYCQRKRESKFTNKLMCELPISERQSIEEHLLVKNLIRKHNKWLKKVGIKPQLRDVQDALQKIKITHANRRRQRVHRDKNKRQKVDHENDITSDSCDNSKSTNGSEEDNIQITNKLIERNQTGYNSEILSNYEESSSALSSNRKQHNKHDLSLFNTKSCQSMKQNAIVPKLWSEQKEPATDKEGQAFKFDQIKIMANVETNLLGQNQTESQNDTKPFSAELISSDNSSKLDQSKRLCNKKSSDVNSSQIPQSLFQPVPRRITQNSSPGSKKSKEEIDQLAQLLYVQLKQIQARTQQRWEINLRNQLCIQ